MFDIYWTLSKAISEAWIPSLCDVTQNLITRKHKIKKALQKKKAGMHVPILEFKKGNVKIQLVTGYICIFIKPTFVSRDE